MSAGQHSPWDERRTPPAAGRLRPAITMQPTLDGEAGEPVGIVIAEVICRENEENDLFAGLAAFVRGELPAAKGTADRALDKLLGELRRKSRKLGADAVLSTSISTLRGADSAGRKLLKMIATGTAVVFPPRDE
jgi:uncharacterized protein YbjQ (UPF0145 family)